MAQLEFSSKFGVDSSLVDFVEERLKPVNGMRTGPYRFVILPQADMVVDLKQTLLEVNLKVETSAGASLTGTTHDDLDFSGNALSSLWDEVQVAVNGKYINVEGSRNIGYKGIIQDWLSLNRDSRAHARGLMEKVKKDGAWRYNKKGFLNDGKTIQLIGHIPVDILTVNNYLSPRNSVSLTFHRSLDSFFFIGDSNSTSPPKVSLQSLYLHVRRLRPSPTILPSLPQWGGDRPEVYHGRYTVVKDFQVPKDVLNWTQNIVLGNSLLPKFVVLGLVPADVFQGKKASGDPMFFKQYDMNKICLKVNDQEVPLGGYQPDFDGLKHCMREYYSLFDTTGSARHFLSLDQWANGGTIFQFNLTTTGEKLHGRVMMPKVGSMSAEISFTKPLPETATLVAYLQCDQAITIRGSSGEPEEVTF